MSNEEDNQITEKSHKMNFSFIKSLVILAILGAVVYFGYEQFMKRNHSSKQVEQQIQKLQMDFDALTNTTQSQQKTLQTLSDDAAQLKQTMAAASQQQSSDEMHAMEVQYLIKLANYNLQYRRSIPQALALLKLADQEIKNLSADRFANLRKALAEDVMDLQSAPQVDTTGIYMRLSALNQKVDQLPLMTKPSAAPENTSAKTETKELAWWQKGLQQTWDTLKNIVVVRYNPTGKIPLLMPEQQAYLFENWHAVLLHAMSALLQGQTEIYQASLQQAENWVKEYGVVDSPITNAFVSELTQLRAININPTIPSLSRSLQVAEALTVSQKGNE